MWTLVVSLLSLSGQVGIGRSFWQLSNSEIATSLLNVFREIIRQTDKSMTLTVCDCRFLFFFFNVGNKATKEILGVRQNLLL